MKHRSLTRYMTAAVASLLAAACSGGDTGEGKQLVETRTSDLTVGPTCTRADNGQQVEMMTNDPPTLVLNPKVYLLFWGNFWTKSVGLNVRTQLTNFWGSMANKPAFWRQLAEYGIGAGSYAGAALLQSNVDLTGSQFDDKGVIAALKPAIG